jgi:hypothetical protein
MWTGCMWHREGTSGSLLWTAISWLSKWLLTSQEGPCTLKSLGNVKSKMNLGCHWFNVYFFKPRLYLCTRSAWKVRGLTLFITPSQNFVEVRWRSLFPNTSCGKRCTSFNAPPTSRKRAADRCSLRNFLPRSSVFMVGKAPKSHGAGSGLYDGCSDGVPLIHFFQTEHRIQFRSRPMRFLDFSRREKGAPRQEISNWSTVCSTFSRSGWSVVRNSSLAKGGTLRNRPSPHLHKVRLGVINKASSRTLQTALVHTSWS